MTILTVIIQHYFESRLKNKLGNKDNGKVEQYGVNATIIPKTCETTN